MKREQTESLCKAQAASALVAVLWAITLASLLLGAFIFDAQIEARIASYYRKRLKADYLALAGLELARWLIVTMPDIGTDAEQDDVWDKVKRPLLEGFDMKRQAFHVGLDREGRELTLAVGENGNTNGGHTASQPVGTIILSIVPEPARRNINNLNLRNNDVRIAANERELVENLELLLLYCGVAEEMFSDFIDPFIDWIDPDDVSRGVPAETEDWYDTLDPPYRAKNGPLDTVGELKLIRHFNEPIEELEEDQETGKTNLVRRSWTVAARLAPLLTTYGDGRVNVNVASLEVLMTIPRMELEVAQELIAERDRIDETTGRRQPFRDWADILRRVRVPIDHSLNKYLAFVSVVFRITSVGELGGVRKGIACTVEYDRARRDMRIISWREEPDEVPFGTDFSQSEALAM
ncbi:MAG: general secretion pathway protein GspK [Kiritimatiellia bacterium]